MAATIPLIYWRRRCSQFWEDIWLLGVTAYKAIEHAIFIMTLDEQGNSLTFKNIKFNPDGTILWQINYTLNPDKHSYLKDLQPTPDDGYVLAGYQCYDPQTAWVLKIDSLGNTCSYIGCDSTVVVEILPGIPYHSNPEVAAMVYPVPASTHLYMLDQIPSRGALWRCTMPLAGRHCRAAQG